MLVFALVTPTCSPAEYAKEFEVWRQQGCWRRGGGARLLRHLTDGHVPPSGSLVAYSGLVSDPATTGYCLGWLRLVVRTDSADFFFYGIDHAPASRM